jgi:hypothetical protein
MLAHAVEMEPVTNAAVRRDLVSRPFIVESGKWYRLRKRGRRRAE